MLPILLISLFLLSSQAKYPIAVFHGFGDSCSFPGMSSLVDYLSAKTQNYVKCIEIGNGSIDSITMKFATQGEKACEVIKADENFKGEIAVIGLSQGALLARYVIENCSTSKRYVSIGGPQMGVADLPKCIIPGVCSVLNWVTRELVYFSFIQNFVGPAGYFKDPYHYQRYLEGSTFLADLNNERNASAFRKQNFLNLEKALFVMFSDDTMIFPKETAHFGFYNEQGNVINFNETDFYTNDYIGLKQLNEENKVDFITFAGEHLQFNRDQIDQYIIPILI